MGRYTTPVVFVLLFCLAAGLMFLSDPKGGEGRLSDSAYDRSALGIKGLELLLEERGIETSRPDGRRIVAEAPNTLRILPIRGGSLVPDDPDQAETTLEDALSGDGLFSMPTLVILPKWHDSVTVTGVARPSQLVDQNRLVRDLARMLMDPLTVKRAPVAFFEEDGVFKTGGMKKTTLFQGQLFDRSSIPGYCNELFGVSHGALLIVCDLDSKFYLLSDPDILNNHGLALGENADTSLTVMSLLFADSSTVRLLIDQSGHSLAQAGADSQAEEPSDPLADFERLFAYPFNVIWGVLLAITLLFFWRGAWRFGPAAPSGITGYGRSKRAVVDAEARLLRLSGNDGQMTAQYVRALLFDKAAHVFGPSARHASDLDRFFAHLANRDKGLSDALHAVATRLMERGGSMKPPELHKNLDLFQTLMGRAELGS